jgi:hypothetical protein
MNKQTLALGIIVIPTMILAVLLSIQLVNATSETFKLFPGGILGKHLIDLQKGDHIEGNFSISNLGPYKNTLTGEMQTYQINVKLIFKSINQSLHTIQEYNRTSGDFFNYTALNPGSISQWTYCSGREFLLNANTPEITFDYEIEPTSPPTTTEPIELETIIGTIIVIAVLGAGLVFFLYLIKKN